MFTNFLIPDFGLQLIISLAIGMLLPERIVNPINNFVIKLPGVKRFENFLSKNKRLRTIIPRIIAGYFFTYLIGGIFLVIGYML
ncbi:MAG: hypothetical protein QXQ40_02200 [Candidatus Aenigmatarchaeota archaeon]